MKSLKSSNQYAGFSLTEMLSVIGIIGVLSAIAIPTLTDTSDASREAAAKRNAQNIASVYEAAHNAGLFFQQSGDDLERVISNTVNGGLADDGAFEGTYFGLSGLSAEEQNAASQYLAMNGEQLRYFPEGAPTNTGGGLSGPKGGGGIYSEIDPDEVLKINGEFDVVVGGRFMAGLPEVPEENDGTLSTLDPGDSLRQEGDGASIPENNFEPAPGSTAIDPADTASAPSQTEPKPEDSEGEEFPSGGRTTAR